MPGGDTYAEKGGCVFNEARVVGMIHRVTHVCCHPSQPLTPPGRLGGAGPRRRLRWLRFT
eukprot:COSAG01_NODE_24_length_37608_cov_19.303154_36_plen_60_part_00